MIDRFVAQISIEFIIILAITLSFILLWLPIIFNTQRIENSAINTFYMEKIANDITYSSDILCILGEGIILYLPFFIIKNKSILHLVRIVIFVTPSEIIKFDGVTVIIFNSLFEIKCNSLEFLENKNKTIVGTQIQSTKPK